MIDIVTADALGLGLFDTDVERAKNILSIQIGALEYLPDFGIDLRYFLNENFVFQNESFKSYLIERLSAYAVNVTSVDDYIDALFEKYTFNIGTNQADGGMVAR